MNNGKKMRMSCSSVAMEDWSNALLSRGKLLMMKKCDNSGNTGSTSGAEKKLQPHWYCSAAQKVAGRSF